MVGAIVVITLFLLLAYSGVRDRAGRARHVRGAAGGRASPPGCASRRSSTSGSSWPCCRSPGSRCRSSAPAAHPSSSALRRSGSCCRSRAKPWRRGRGTTMRLLIAAGGTGGHIYPALAVARSLSASPEAPELRWLGGHRGLEANLVPAAGIPLRRLAARSLRTTEARRPRRPRSRSGSAFSVPQATAILVERAAGGGLHDRRLRGRARPAGRRPAADPGRAVGRQRHPRPGGAGDGAPGRRAGGLVRGDVPGARIGRAGTALLRHRHADPRRVGDRPRGGPGHGWTSRPGERVLLIFGGSQAVRRFNAAVAEALPRLVERVTVIHVTGDEGYAAALAGREAPARGGPAALPAVPVPARRDAGRAGHGRPRRRPGRVLDAGRGDRARRADGRRARTRTRPGTSGRTRRAWSRPEPPG